MAATCQLLDASRSARVSGRAGTYQATYRIITSTNPGGPLQAIIEGWALSLPAQYATYALDGGVWIDPGSYAQDFECETEHEKEKNIFLCRVGWRPIEPGTSTSASAPESRPAVYSVEFWEESQIITHAYNVSAITPIAGSARAADTLGLITNAARQTFDDPLVEEDKIVVIVGRINLASLAAVITKHKAFHRSLNSDTWQGYTKHKAKFVGISAAEPIVERNPAGGSWTYVPCEIRVAVKDTEWYQPVVNRGTKGYVSKAGVYKLEVLRDAQGIPFSEASLLKADGTREADDTLGNKIDYRTRAEVSYATLGI